MVSELVEFFLQRTLVAVMVGLIAPGFAAAQQPPPQPHQQTPQPQSNSAQTKATTVVPASHRRRSKLIDNVHIPRKKKSAADELPVVQMGSKKEPMPAPADASTATKAPKTRSQP